jgi:ADP-heptose:LPS heptosyltransferase
LEINRLQGNRIEAAWSRPTLLPVMSATPADHAAACLAWLAGRSAAEIDAALADPAHPTYAHADALGDAADGGDPSGIGALFGGLVEPLNDGFTPAGRAGYARWFAHICWRVGTRDERIAAQVTRFGISDEAALHARYQAARRQPASPPRMANKVVVLSRVTIGADLLLTTVALQRLRRAYPEAELVVLGDGKLQALIGGLPGVRVRAVAYGRRGTLRERLASWLAVVEAVAAEAPDLVFAPDSRLDQLGILPVVADPARYLLWENVLPDGQALSLARALDAFLAERFAQPAQPPIEPRTQLDVPTLAVQAQLAAALGSAPLAAVKLDHGGNPAKALPRAAEVAVLRRLRDLGWRVLLDRGFGAAELANSDALLADAGWTAVDLDDSGQGLGQPVAALTPGALATAPVVRFHGSIGGWAAACAVCRVAVSYDSVGHHLAAGLGVPVITAFTGHTDARFAVAWKPHGPGAVTLIEIPTAAKDDPAQWARLLAALPAV